jgi:ISXO2-like transposase domain
MLSDVVYCSMSSSLSSMFSMQDLDAFITAPKRLLKFLRDRFLLLPLHTPCPHSSHHNIHFMGYVKRNDVPDEFSYYCSQCNTRISLRHRSIFQHSTQTLLVCCRILVCFDLQLTVTQTAALLGLSRNIVGDFCDFYYYVRDKLFNYMHTHFRKLSSNEVLEHDELFLRHLIAIGPDQEELPATWIFGILSRTTGRVYLQIIPDREASTFENIYNQCVEPDAMVLTDGWSYGNWLNRRYRHYVCKKVPVPGHTIEEPWEVNDSKFGKIMVHTNSIEGFWAEFRAKLHWSRGWPAIYMPYILAEFMYRKEGISPLIALQIQ